MNTNKLTLILCLFVIFGTISCENTDETNTNPNYNGLYDFYLYDVNTGVTTKITSSPDQTEHSYSFSPDSKKILYVNTNGINEMNIDGSGNRVIISKGSGPSYSQDGKQIAFVDNGILYTINIDGTNKIQMNDESIWLGFPVWSRDGENIVCSSENGLCIVSLTGNTKVFISGNSADWYDWSYDSKEIYYSRFVSDNFAQIFKYNLIQDKESQITDIDKYNYTPKANPVKNKIIFTSSLADYGGDLVIIDAEGMDQNVILHKNQIITPYWSPDGERIVFVTEGLDLAIIDKDGSNYKKINEIPGACMEPKWSSDGKYIVYYRAVYFL